MTAAVVRPDGAELHRLYMVENVKLETLARRYRVGAATMRVWLQEAGIAVRRRGYSPSHARRHARPTDDQLRRWLEDGCSVSAIAQQCGVVESTAYRWLGRAGIASAVGRPRVSDAKRPTDVELWHMYRVDRLNLAQIAARCRVSKVTVHRWVTEARIPMRGPSKKGGLPAPSAARLRKMYVTDGRAIGDIATTAGVSARTARRWLVEAGIDIRPPSPQPGHGGLARPLAAQLHRWYVTQLMTTDEIASRCGVASTSTIVRWLREAGVPLRPPGRSVQARGLRTPTAEELRRLVWQEHRPYREIALMYGCDPSAVAHWLNESGIPRPTTWETIRAGTKPDMPTPEVLRARYATGESLRAIADDYTVSWQTIRELATASGVELRPTGWYFGPPINCADGHTVRSTYEKRVDDWLSAHGLAHEIEPTVPYASRWRADFKVGETYIEVWGMAGSATYDERKRAKINWYREHDVALLEIPRWLFDQRSRHLLERRLTTLIIPESSAPSD
jgi:transposase